MKIQLASTLPFTPVQIDVRHPSPRRMVGQLFSVENGIEYQQPVYEFRHNEDRVQYRVDMSECARVGSDIGDLNKAANDDCMVASPQPVWIEHEPSHNYKPYAFMVMNAMTKLVGDWDGVVYRTPSGERLRESAFKATLQVIDACVSKDDELWMMVKLKSGSAENTTPDNETVRQMGWVPVAKP